jgi:hypothetical protein
MSAVAEEMHSVYDTILILDFGSQVGHEDIQPRKQELMETVFSSYHSKMS